MEITNINQLLPLVAQKPEFVVLDKGDFQVIDYVYQDQNTFDIPELMECRGIKFCKDGLILARPFRKFFNYGERGSGLPVHRPHVITVKLDGSMIHPVLLDRRLFFHTRKGHTDVAKKAERVVLSTPWIDYQGFCIEAIKAGWTPIFEFTSPNNRIVLRYEDDALTLLAMRHMVTGNMMARTTMAEMARASNVPLVPVFEFDLTKDVLGFVQHARDLVDAEGYVVYFDDGYMVKIKAQDYVLKHRALDDLGSKRKVVALCAQGFMDDVLPILSEPDAQELMEFNDALQIEVNKLAMAAEGAASIVVAGNLDRKTFALEWAPNLKPKWLASVCFRIMDGKNARMLVLKAIERNYDDLNVKWRGE
jgi:RNA ligase